MLRNSLLALLGTSFLLLSNLSAQTTPEENLEAEPDFDSMEPTMDLSIADSLSMDSLEFVLSELMEEYEEEEEDNSVTTRLSLGALFLASSELLSDNWTLLDDPLYDDRFGASTNVQYDLVVWRFPSYRSHLGVITGLGLDWSRVAISSEYELLMGNDDVLVVPSDPLAEIRVNRLETSYLRVPLLVSVKTSKMPKKGVIFEAGVVAGVRVAGKYVTEYDLDGVNYSTEARNIGLSRFMVNGRASVGFKKVHLFAEAALLPLFEKTVTAPVSYSTVFGTVVSGFWD